MDSRVIRISLAPVKALGLVHPDQVVLGPNGVVGDRRFWLLDERGVLFNGKRDGALHGIRPDWDEATRRLVLTFPDASRVDGTVELGEPVEAEMYGVSRPSHRVVGPWESAISDYVGRQLTLLWADDGAVDRAPEGGSVSLISSSSLARVADEAGVAGPLDGRRFRMLFDVDGIAAHEEDEWIGREVRIGEATVAFNGDVGRCVVTSRHPETGIPDVPTLAALAAYRRDGRNEPLPCGIYGSVVVPGVVRIGDSVVVGG